MSMQRRSGQLSSVERERWERDAEHPLALSMTSPACFRRSV